MFAHNHGRLVLMYGITVDARHTSEVFIFNRYGFKHKFNEGFELNTHQMARFDALLSTLHRLQYRMGQTLSGDSLFLCVGTNSKLNP